MIRALVIAVLAAVAVPSGFLWLAGKPPLATWCALLTYTLGTWIGFSDVLVHAIPLTLLGVGVAVAFRANIWNVGGDGQLICGAVLAVALAPLISGLTLAAQLLFLLAGVIGGGLIGGIVGWLRARFGANEIIVTIMMNYVALQLLTWVIRGPLQDPVRVFPRSFALAASMQLPVISGGTRLHAGLLLAALAAVLMQIVISGTAFGFRLAVLGENLNAADYAGINSARTTVAAMAISGAFAGLAGAVEIAGVHQRLQDNFAGGFGIEAIAVALMARLNPIAIPLTAMLFGIFFVGSGALQRQMSVPFPLVWIIEGVVILAFLAFEATAAHRAGWVDSLARRGATRGRWRLLEEAAVVRIRAYAGPVIYGAISVFRPIVEAVTSSRLVGQSRSFARAFEIGARPIVKLRVLQLLTEGLHRRFASLARPGATCGRWRLLKELAARIGTHGGSAIFSAISVVRPIVEGMKSSRLVSRPRSFVRVFGIGARSTVKLELVLKLLTGILRRSFADLTRRGASRGRWRLLKEAAARTRAGGELIIYNAISVFRPIVEALTSSRLVSQPRSFARMFEIGDRPKVKLALVLQLLTEGQRRSLLLLVYKWKALSLVCKRKMGFFGASSKQPAPRLPIDNIESYGRSRQIVTSGKEDEDFFRQRGFGVKIGFGERPALIVIDMLKGFTDPSMPLGANLDREIAALQPLLQVAHERQIPVIFTTVIYEEAEVKDAGLWAIKMKGSHTLTAGSQAVKVDPRLDRQRRDILLVKKYASCFFGTDLLSRLMTRRVDTLIITGCTTSGCVRATAVDAVQNGVRPMVVREAVGDRSAAAHEQSLFDLNAKYADVVSLDETLQYLRTVGHNRPTGL